jgi:hypothetical protein
MAQTAFRQEDGIGLAVAIAAHAALFALLVLRPVSGDILMPPARIAVTLSDEVGLVSTSPDPFHDAAPDIAPTIGDPETSEPAPSRLQSPASEPPASDRASAVSSAPTRPSRRTGGSRIGSDFLEGVRGGSAQQGSGGPLAEAMGPDVRSSLSGAITRQLKPHWAAPQGVDAERLVTVLAWDLNEDGSLAGAPRVLSQSGITASNRAQAGRHAEQAIRAVQLAAPFELPSEYYDSWKRVSAFRFDKRLSQ